MLATRGSLLSKAMAVALSVSMALGGVPTQALAEILDEAAEVPAQGQPAPADQLPATDDLVQGGSLETAQSAEDDPSPDEQDTLAAPSGTGDEDAESEPLGQEDSSSEPMVAEQKVDAPEESSAASAVTEASKTPARGAAADGQASAGMSALELASDSYLMIQTTKDVDGYSSRVQGELSVGSVLWANVHDYDSDEAIVNDGSWTYQWYASASKSTSLSSYEAIEGQTAQSLVITKELSTQLAGKYIVATMTAGSTTYTGPGFRGISSSYVPGPVAADGVVSLYNVTLSNSDPCVGDTITATANKSYGTPVPEGTEVSYVWTVEGVSDPVQQGSANSLEVDQAWQGKRITVSVNAGANTVSATTSAVAAKGAIRLYEVTLDAPVAAQVGATLTAHAYRGSYSSKTEVTEGVTFTWLVADSKSYSASWTPIEDESGSTLVVPESCEGKYVRVQATAGGINTVEVSYYSALGPFKQPGAYTIYVAYAFLNGETSGNNAYTTEDTLWALARETSGGAFLPADGLTYQWLAGTAYNRNANGYEELAGETSQTLSLMGLEGKYVAVRVSSKIGSSSYVAAVTKPVASPGSVNVTSVTVSPSGEVNPGDTVTATASSPSGDVTADERVSWSWWRASSASGTYTQIAGATGPTLSITEDLLNCYVRARADGGFGDVSSTQTVGPVVAKGAVGLYNVSVTGDAVCGRTLTAKANKTSTTAVAAGDVVTYVWEYAASNTTSDSAFAPIAGAPNSATFTIPETASDGTSLVGKYIRVRAISKDVVVSTSQRYSQYGQTSTRSVDPLGPVRLDGGYDLTSVAVSSSGQGAQAGSVLTPKAQYLYKGSYSSYETDVPSDAKVTYVWHASDAGGTGDTVLTSGVDEQGRLTLTDDLVGREVWCVAGALMTPATSERIAVRAEDDYDLLRVQFATPSNTSTTVVTGDSVAVDVYAKRLGVTYTGTTGSADRVTDRIGNGVNLQWYVGESASGPWTALDGATNTELSVPAEAAGRYLRAEATSGTDEGNVVSVVYPQKIVGADSLEGVVAKLVASNWRPEPVFGTDTNINDLLHAELERLGIATDDIAITTTSASFNSTREEVSVGISTDEADNGNITYLWADLDAMSYFYPTSYQQATVTFQLERNGETVSFTPSRRTVIGWDEDKARSYLEEKAEALAIGYAEGDSAEGVTGTMSLPNSISGTSWAKVSTWESSDAAVSVTGSSWQSARTGTPTRGAADVPVTLTATVAFSGSSVPAVTVEKTFDVVVLADAERVAQELASLQEKLENGFSYEKVKDSETGEAIDPQAIKADIQLPTPRTLGVDGRDYQVSYTSTNSAIAPNGYRGAVVRPLPGSGAKQVELTCTITSKANPSITASKTLAFVVEPASADDIDAELALLEEVRAAYLDGIINGNDPKDVTGNLHGFQKAYRASDGSLAWAYSVSEASGHLGIVPVELPGYDPMGPSDQARLFASSAPQVIQNENLVLASTPTYDTQVTISSVLASERYGSYYERYKDDSTASRELLQKLAVLAGQDAQATVTVRGTNGADERPDSDKSYVVPVTVIGPDASGNLSTWAKVSVKAVDGDGQTAADATATALATRDLAYAFAGSVLEEIVSPVTGQPVANEENGAYWQLWVNGSYSERYANGVYLARGTSVVWQYAESSDELALDAPSVEPDDPNPPVDPNAKVEGEWSQSIEDGNVTSATTPTTGGEPAWQVSVRSGSSSVSEPIIAKIGGARKVVTFSGRDAYVTDAETGKVTVVKGVLQANMSLTSRPILSDGIVYVPLNGGRVQAVSLNPVAPLWVSDAVGATSNNSTCSARVVEADGRSLVIVGTSEGNDSRAGSVVAVDAATGEVAWSASNASSGYFWTGAVVSGGNVVMADSAGTLHVLDGATGKEVSSAKVSSAAINADLVVADDSLLAMDRAGVLHKVSVGTDGKLTVTASVKVGEGATAAPVVVGGKLVCATCGPVGDDSSAGGIVVVDLGTLKVEQTVTSAGGKPIAGGVKGSALVSVQSDGTYCYVATNDGVGSVYVYRLGDKEASLFYVPESAQFCDSPLVCDADGNLYYINDSGVLVRLKAGDAPQQPSDPQKPSAPSKQDSGRPGTDTTGAGSQAKTNAAPISLRPSISLHSNVATPAQRGSLPAAAESLLAAVDSTLLEGPVVLTTEGDTPIAAPAASDPAQAQLATRRLPIWPLIGMACGAITLLLLMMRRREDEEE